MKSETECPRWGTQRAGLAAALIAAATLSTPTRADVIVEGTIAPWLWNGNNYYLGSLIDPGIFATAGTSLTGDPIQILWHTDPAITADITINGTTITLGPATGFFAPYATVTPTYQNITVQLVPNVAIDSFDPVYAAKNNPHGIGGSLELVGMDGYFYVTSMIDLAQVPAPIVGGGPIGLVMCGLLIVGLGRKYRRSTSVLAFPA